MSKNYTKLMLSIIAVNFILLFFSIDTFALSKSLSTIGDKFTDENGVIYTVVDDTNVNVIGHMKKDNIIKLMIPSTVEYLGFDFVVQSIEANSFENAALLEEVYISYGVKNINEAAFSSLPSLKLIYLPQSIVSVETGAFTNCPVLEQAHLAFEEYRIDENTVFGVNLPQQIMFYINPPNDSEITQENAPLIDFLYPTTVNAEFDNSVYINGVLYRLNHETQQASVISNVVSEQETILEIPTRISYSEKEYDVIAIGDSAFEGMKVLKSVVIPQSVTSIGAGAFQNSPKLSSVIINAQDCVIGENSFNNIGITAQNENVYFKMSDEVYYQSFSSNDTNWDKERYILASDATDGEEFTVDGLVYEVISNSPYEVELISAENMGITELILSDTVIHRANVYAVVSVKAKSFFGSELETIFLPDTIVKVGESAFEGSANLKNIYIASVKVNMNIDDNAFAQVGSSKNGVFFKGVSPHKYYQLSITANNWDNAYYFYNFEQAKVDDTFDLGRFTYKITSISEEGGSVEILGFAPGYTANIAEFPNIINYKLVDFIVTSIGTEAFMDNDALTKIVLGDSISKIGENAFANCEKLSEITFNYPYSQMNIDKGAFADIGGTNPVVFYGALDEKYTDLVEELDNWEEDRYRYSPILTTMKASDEKVNVTIGVSFPGSYDVKSMQLEALPQEEIDQYMSHILSVGETSQILHERYTAIYAYDVILSGYNEETISKSICPIEIFFELNEVSLGDKNILYVYADENGETQLRLLEDESAESEIISAAVDFDDVITIILLENKSAHIEVDDTEIMPDEKREIYTYLFIALFGIIIVTTIMYISFKYKKRNYN